MFDSIDLVNFRSHSKSHLDFAQFNIQLGRFGSGKSSILHALSLILTGQNPIVNAKGEGLEDEIRHGEKEFEVWTKLHGNGDVGRRKVLGGSHAIRIDGAYQGVRQAQGRLFERLGVQNADILLAILDPTPFFKREQKEQVRTLLQFMGNVSVEAPATVRKLGLAERFSSVGEINDIIKRVKDETVRGLNSEVKTLNAQIQPAQRTNPEKRQALGETIQKLNAERDQAIRLQSAETEWRKTLERLNDEAAKSEGLATLDAKVAELAFQIAAKEIDLPALRTKHAEKKAISDDASSQLQKLAMRLEAALKLVAQVKAIEGECPTCSRKLPEKEKRHLLGILEKELEGVKSEHGTMVAAVKLCREELSTVEADGFKVRKEVDDAKAEKAKLEARSASVKELARNLEAHKSSRPQTGDWPKKLADVSSKIAAAEIERKGLEDAEAAESRRAIQVAEVRSKQARAEEYSAAVKELEAIKDQLLEETSGGFIEDMKRFLNPFGLNDIQFSADPFGFKVNGLSAGQLSGGQQIIIEAALRVAAAKASKLNVLAIDDASHLNQVARSKLGQLLRDSGLQVILCSTLDDPPAGGVPPGMRVFWFENTQPPWGPTTVRVVGG